ncbi:MAG: hypothetical protein ACREQ5_21710, partial [Candidatus Dormibacteria bacterium]
MSGVLFFDQGITDLVSVIPPGAQLTPSSKISSAQVGKVPGRRGGNGLWGGYDWRKHAATRDDVRAWSVAGASIGVLAGRYPGIDIDCTDPTLAETIQDLALTRLGWAPIRTGRPPKRLLMYRTSEPFGRLRLWVIAGGTHHLVEILGEGQQYLVSGIHPGTLKPYAWSEPLDRITAAALTAITVEDARAFLDDLAARMQQQGHVIEREGDGRATARAAVEQAALVAPSLELLRRAVECVPNTNALFPERTHYLRMGYAIRAAVGPEIDEGQAIFSAWASRWLGNDRASGNDPETVLADWRRMRGPYAVGWNWIAEQARPFGFDDAALDFTATGRRSAEDTGTLVAPLHSDQWLADQVAEAQRGVLRYVPTSEQFIVWNGSWWVPDAD